MTLKLKITRFMFVFFLLVVFFNIKDNNKIINSYLFLFFVF